MKRLHTRLGSLLSGASFSVTSKGQCIDSNRIRNEFIKFFTENYNHTFLKSSPVVPFCDPSVPFVNAGMNQFKGIFLGQNKPPYNRVVNSQKCIRIGGKHNDLECVGVDGYHHTFFEMLGNWSFGDYFKEKACKMAWELLTGPYRLNQERLYVTYFGGDKEMGIEPDVETKNIWQSIGVPSDRIIAFGPKENFWEMGPTGPCGPCTEIHYDHEHGRRNVSDRVNRDHDDVVEIWNLVFIQYNRAFDGSLKKLPCFHVDTGMGLERLVAILQGKKSNYDTDLFIPLFNAIQKISGAPTYTGGRSKLDTDYRILADHIRMITIALADGMFPHQNFKLRRVLRRALDIAENTFKCDRGLVPELTNYVADSLAEAYPEVEAKLKQIQLIICHEEEILKSLQKTVLLEWKALTQNHSDLDELNVEMTPGIVGAFKELKRVIASNTKSIPPDLVFKLYDTYGLDMRTIGILCSHFGLEMDQSSFQDLLQGVRKKSREMHQVDISGNDVSALVMKYAKEHKLLPTDDSFKYMYYKQKDYVFPSLESRILGIVCENHCVSQGIPGLTCDLIFDQTNLYHDAGGQISDTGYLNLKNGTRIHINEVTNIQGYLLHRVEIPEDCSLSVGDKVTLEVVSGKRLDCMRNHTATHLVNAALSKMLTVTCQKSSQVTDSSLTFEFAVYGERFDSRDVKKVEELVQTVVSSAVPVKRETVNGQKLQELYITNRVTLVPGEVYPQDEVHIIEIVDKNLVSREACCGTHVINTADIGEFCVTSVKSPSSGTRTLTAVTGSKAADARRESIYVLDKVSEFKKCVSSLTENISTSLEEVRTAEKNIQNIMQKLITQDKHTLPHTIHVSCLDELVGLSKKLKQYGRTFSRENLEDEMQIVLQNLQTEPFVVHFLKCSSSADDIPLQKATKMCPHLPVLLIAASGDSLKARCCVPKKFISEKFNAKLWMEEVLSVFEGKGFAPRGQNSEEVFNMKKKYVKEDTMSTLLNDAVTSAKKFAEFALHKS
ncbi:hypothetical protein R5R35_008960 [Gryllus longicercus]|uniref:Alanine--tRNA ligase n=1 Tax=Gryllus longicercus TaxID=2509291 RepID=A0AAN9VZX1_9ORTH